MPAPVRIAALIAILALLVPGAALAQSDDGGAGDSQYQDPFGSSQPAKPAKPSTPAQQQQQPAQQQQQQQQQQQTQTSPAPAPAAQSRTPQGQAQQGGGSQTLPRTGFDVLPVAAAGLLLLLGGLALRRRPHGER
jgi:LPXTG-motif cell wall-anchored protein